LSQVIVAVVLLACCSQVSSTKLLMVVTNVGQFVQTTGPADQINHNKSTGYWLSELTHSYDVFKAANYTIDIASPLGGYAPVDPPGFVLYAMDPVTSSYVMKDSNNNSYVPLTQNTLSLANMTDDQARSYDAMFVVGGTGGMFDYHNSTSLIRVTKVMWEAKKIVSAVCHGPVAWSNVMLSNGQYMVKGKTLTGFSNDEEQVLGKSVMCAVCGLTPGCNVTTCGGPYMPTEYTAHGSYMLESKLKERGALYTATAQDWNTFYYTPHVVVDGRLISGQNPGAPRETAQAVVYALQVQANCSADQERAYFQADCSKIVQMPGDPPVVCNFSTTRTPLVSACSNFTITGTTSGSSSGGGMTSSSSGNSGSSAGGSSSTGGSSSGGVSASSTAINHGTVVSVSSWSAFPFLLLVGSLLSIGA